MKYALSSTFARPGLEYVSGPDYRGRLVWGPLDAAKLYPTMGHAIQEIVQRAALGLPEICGQFSGRYTWEEMFLVGVDAVRAPTVRKVVRL